jgi:integrase
LSSVPLETGQIPPLLLNPLRLRSLEHIAFLLGIRHALLVIHTSRVRFRDDYLFINRRTGKPYTTIMKVWNRLRNKAGLPHLRIHDLRHSYASFLVNSGRTLYEVQKILGHASASTSERYSHLSSKSLQDAANTASVIITSAMPVTEVETEVVPGAVVPGAAQQAA